MPLYIKTGEIESNGRTLYVTACDPEFYDETVEGCTTRVAIGDDPQEFDAETLTGADEHAVDAWLHTAYYPHALRLRMNDDLEDAAEVLFEGKQADERAYGPGDADYR